MPVAIELQSLGTIVCVDGRQTGSDPETGFWETPIYRQPEN